MIECNMFEDKLKEYKKESETLIDQLRKNVEASYSQIQTLSS